MAIIQLSLCIHLYSVAECQHSFSNNLGHTGHSHFFQTRLETLLRPHQRLPSTAWASILRQRRRQMRRSSCSRPAALLWPLPAPENGLSEGCQWQLASEEERKVLAAGKQAASLACLCRSQLAAQLTCCGVRGPGRLLTRAAKRENVVFDRDIV